MQAQAQDGNWYGVTDHSLKVHFHRVSGIFRTFLNENS